jgi:poly(hydroxyalkanoate) granule-associated protein
MPKSLIKSPQFPALRGSAHQIWLAGLGALSMAEDESGKIFKTLVKRGKTFEASTKDRLSSVRDALDLRKAASTTMTRISDNLDDGMNGVLGRLGLPSKKEIDALGKRVDRLTKALEEKPVHKTARRTAGSKRQARAAV